MLRHIPYPRMPEPSTPAPLIIPLPAAAPADSMSRAAEEEELDNHKRGYRDIQWSNTIKNQQSHPFLVRQIPAVFMKGHLLQLLLREGLFVEGGEAH